MEKDKFLQIFNNFVLYKLIFKHIKSIHNVITQNVDSARYSWSEVIEKPTVMARYSYLRELKLYYSEHPIFSFGVDTTHTFNAAIKSGNIEMLKYLVELAKPIASSPLHIRFSRILKYAAMYGSLEMVEYICTEFAKKRLNYRSAFSKSPLSGDIEIVEYLKKKLEIFDLSFLNSFLYNAAKKGRIDMIEWMIENRPKGRSNSCMYYAAIEGGHLHVVQYLLDIKEPFIFDPDYGSFLEYSIYFNQLEIAKLFHQHNIIESEDTLIDYAALNGNIECLKWLNENTTFEASVQAMNNAATNNHLEVLKWLRQHRTEGCSDDIIQIISRKGYIEVIQWLYENQSNVLQSRQSIDVAISYGHLELAKWFFEKRNEQPSLFAIDSATLNGNESSEIRNFQMIKWLHDNHPNLTHIDVFDKKSISASFRNGCKKLIRWFHNNNIQGVFNDESIDISINVLEYPLVRWIYENRSDCQCSFVGFKSAIKTGHMGMIEYLLEKHSEFGHQISMEDSLEHYFKKEDIEMIEFLLDKLDYPLVELKKFEKIINSTDYSNISKTLLNELIKEEINSIVGNSDRSDIPNEQIKKR
ncbi:hypothetical protein PPL_09391 [Heterostelium album PN500]|uniref:Ankyrin repeat protein n=1 Tax=Heterostelium pallidum (strain ATCC 26659 / Pp 5 / PN500) TaxID=670386 RepID=D3BLF7_HETP5|nr:hypothetical protein PPL_09391 [Heterostelium album PN500]EFA77891.1 hypothetical protein PPL_09391 [Heterostelium album PN500]|eukprot:XP_020430019.1 hypothetical protein PPL_09391 [Heterostelium album PN500]